MHSPARRTLAALALAAAPFLTACTGDTEAAAVPTSSTTAAAPDVDRLDLADTLGTEPAATSTAVPTAAVPAPGSAGETQAHPAGTRSAPVTTAPAPSTTAAPSPAAVAPVPQPAPAPVADPCFRADPECYDVPAPVECAAGEVWDGAHCTAAQLDDERIGRQVDGPGGEVCTVVAVNPDRLDCATRLAA